MLTIGLIMACVGYAYCYWRFHCWCRRRELRAEFKLEKERREYQERIVEQYRVKGYDLDRREFGTAA